MSDFFYFAGMLRGHWKLFIDLIIAAFTESQGKGWPEEGKEMRNESGHKRRVASCE